MALILSPDWCLIFFRDPAVQFTPARLLPILADAGRCDEQILEHCFGHGPHIRDCRVVDLVLDRQ